MPQATAGAYQCPFLALGSVPCEGAILRFRARLAHTAPSRPMPPRLQSLMQSSSGSDLGVQGHVGLAGRAGTGARSVRPVGCETSGSSPPRGSRPLVVNPGRRHRAWPPLPPATPRSGAVRASACPGSMLSALAIASLSSRYLLAILAAGLYRNHIERVRPKSVDAVVACPARLYAAASMSH